MTLEDINSMTLEERHDFINIICHTFQEGQTFEDYTRAIRDYIYIWRRLDENRKGYTFDGITERVKLAKPVIKQYYSEKSPVDDAAIDIDYSCG